MPDLIVKNFMIYNNAIIVNCLGIDMKEIEERFLIAKINMGTFFITPGITVKQYQNMILNKRCKKIEFDQKGNIEYNYDWRVDDSLKSISPDGNIVAQCFIYSIIRAIIRRHKEYNKYDDKQSVEINKSNIEKIDIDRFKKSYDKLSSSLKIPAYSKGKIEATCIRAFNYYKNRYKKDSGTRAIVYPDDIIQ